jgi:small subunit ribosomal protein S13
MVQQELKHIVRIVNTDLNGNRKIGITLRKVKGVSFSMINAILKLTKIDPNKKTGYLTDDEIRKLQEFVKEPQNFDIPEWMLNRRRDYETGKDFHLVGIDLDLAKDDDIKRMKRIKSYKGLRHAWRLPVRGQRTRSNFRPNKGKVVGVTKKADAKGGRV